MSFLSLATKRSSVRIGLLTALFFVVAVVAFLLTGTVGYLAGSSDAAVRQALAASPPTAVAVHLEARLADDREAQAESTADLIDEAFAGASVTSHRMVQSNPVTALTETGESAEVLLAADPELVDRLRSLAC